MTFVLSPPAAGRGDGNPVKRNRAAELLRRYPDLDGIELDELIDFYKTAPAVDTALLTCEEALKANIAAFERAYRKRISRWRDGISTLAAFGLFIAALAITVVYHMD